MSSTFYRVEEHVIQSQYIREYPGATAEAQENSLYLHIKQYSPLDQPESLAGAATIIAAHANGFPKELYEPLWDELYLKSRKAGFKIGSIWIADVAHQGRSSVLNEDMLGNDPSWNDHPRDMLHLINHFRDKMPRPLFGIGHSMGGCQLASLSLIHPRLLASLILIDPVIQVAGATGTSKEHNYAVANASTFRRDLWSSREEAMASFMKSSFYKSWDSRVLERWAQYGLRAVPTAIYPRSVEEAAGKTPVTLTTTKHQEVWTFLRPNFRGQDIEGKPILNRTTHPDIPIGHETSPFYRPEPESVFKSLPFLRPSILYIFGGLSNMSTPEARNLKMAKTGVGVGGSGGAQEGRVRQVLFEDAGHLIPMEFVRRTAYAAVDWIEQEMKLWRTNEEDWRRQWGAKKKIEKMRVSKEWKDKVGGEPVRGKASAPHKL